MKQLLSLLLCFVFLNAQIYAKHELPGGGSTSLTGIYGGVLLPTSSTDTGATTSNTLGIFAFAMPSSGFGAGSLLMFANGTVYNGTINAIGNRDTLKITAILQATYNFTLSLTLSGTAGQSIQTENVTATANGSMKATVDNSSTVTTLNGTASIGVTTGEVDSATLNPIIVEQTEFEVSGIRESTGITVASVTRVAIP